MRDYDVATPRMLEVASGSGFTRMPDITYACHALSDGQALCGYPKSVTPIRAKWSQLLEWQRCRACDGVIVGHAWGQRS
jgi:hypothetical protein